MRRRWLSSLCLLFVKLWERWRSRLGLGRGCWLAAGRGCRLIVGGRAWSPATREGPCFTDGRGSCSLEVEKEDRLQVEADDVYWWWGQEACSQRRRSGWSGREVDVGGLWGVRSLFLSTLHVTNLADIEHRPSLDRLPWTFPWLGRCLPLRCLTILPRDRREASSFSQRSRSAAEAPPVCGRRRFPGVLVSTSTPWDLQISRRTSSTFLPI